MVQLIGNRSRPRRHLVVRGRVDKPGRRGKCGLVRVRPQPRLLLAGRPIECCVRLPVSAAEATPDAVSLVAGGKTSGGPGLFSRKTERAGVWTVESAASKPGEGTGSGRRGSISTPRSRARGSTVNPSLVRVSRKKARPKKTTAVAVATTPREMR
jgi:hypothetical protein